MYDNFINNKEQTSNQKLCNVREVFEEYNLISGLHTFFSKRDEVYKNLLPPLRILNNIEETKLINNLKILNFT